MPDPPAPDVLARLEALVYDDDARLNGAEWGCNVRRSQLAALLAVARDHAHLTEEVRTLRLLVAVNEASQIPDGETRIGGKRFRLERHGDLNRYGLVPVSPSVDPEEGEGNDEDGAETWPVSRPVDPEEG